MCPACIGGVAVAVGSATSAGGVTALIVKKIFSKIPKVKNFQIKEPDQNQQKIKGE